MDQIDFIGLEKYCEWKYAHWDYWKISCISPKVHYDDKWKYCPYCGKEIIIREEN